MQMVYVSDGKAGHRSQALGLYQAMHRQVNTGLHFTECPLEELNLCSLFTALITKKPTALHQAPDYIIGVGSHTQLRVLLLGKIYPQAKTIILMKPNYPMHWFDYVVLPEHDGVQASDRIIVTQGAINPIVNEQRHQANRILVALGGSSKRHQWNAEKVLAAIEQIVIQNATAEIVLTTSRRTPIEFLTTLSKHSFSKGLQVFPVEDTPQGWIFEQMQLAEAVWVTEDSVSMIYEALTAGCRVGVIEMERINQDRITRSVDQLLHCQRVSIQLQLKHLPFANALNESQRVAKFILNT
ncbi:hypothetical protein EC844_106125 [Acinetobacter calcoaceticus]|uniref:Nucleoside-diphosphate sugar epimerase n=1 Tax=Acinetobacter calcoaceticus TaxID=471 RepID=A0A4R1XXY1_ACICA|nr:hypothetical protein EC844_106125 [Acinetobacter calcoaceticus]